MKTMIRVLLCLCAFAAGTAYASEPLPVNGAFASPQDSGLPRGWSFHPWEKFQPHPRAEIMTTNEGNVLSLTDIKGPQGTGIRSARFKAKPGDRVSGNITVRGSGDMSICLYLFYGSNGWAGGCPSQRISLTPAWTHHRFHLTVPEGWNRQADSFRLVLHAAKGTRLQATNLDATLTVTEYPGTVRFPTSWDVFAPADASYVPKEQELLEMPKTFAGILPHPKKITSRQGRMDFKPYFPKHQVGNCAWLFTTITSPVDADYTIGAGADWFMKVFLNGKPIIDTLSTGNNSGDVSITNYVRKVRLRRGNNILAVKFVTGKASAILTMGGPSELRDRTMKLVPVKLFTMEDFETPSKWPDSPELVKGILTPNILIPNTAAVFQTDQPTNLLPECTPFNPQSLTTEDYYTTGFQLRQLSKNTDELKARLRCGAQHLDMAVARQQTTGKLRWILRHNGKVLVDTEYPDYMLPAHTLLSIRKDGECLISINSLDSSSTSIRANVPNFFQDGTPVTRSLDLIPHKGQTAEATLDDIFHGIYTRQSQRISPMNITVKPTFDPVKEGWKLIFQDEFDGNKVDEDKWHITRNKHLANLKNGKLHITCTYDEKRKTLNSSSLWSKQKFQFGYAEARLKFTRQYGWCAAFWLCTELPTNAFTDGFEIDIFEDMWNRDKPNMVASKTRLDHTLHAYYGMGLLKSWAYHCNLPRGRDDFYTLGCLWTPAKIVFYLDGQAIAAQASHSPYKHAAFDAVNHVSGTAPLQTILSGCTGRIKDHTRWNLKKFPEDFVIDYVRVYELPKNGNPTIRWTAATDMTPFVKPGDIMVFDVDAKPDEETQSPITGVFLFDNGSLIASKTSPPYRFEIPFLSSFFDTTGYVIPGIQKSAPNLFTTTHHFSAYAQNKRGNLSLTPLVKKIPVFSQRTTPFGGTPATIPGTLKLAKFDDGGPHLSWCEVWPRNAQAITTRNHGEITKDETRLTQLAPQEWYKYTVNVTEPGTYRMILDYQMNRVSEVWDQHVIIYSDNRKLAELHMPKSQEAKRILKQPSTLEAKVNLSAGRQVITLETHCFYNGFDLKSLQFIRE